MFEILKNAWKVKEIRTKILYTLLMLLIFRLGNYITLPFIDASGLQKAISNNSLMGLLDSFTGNGLARFTIFATGIVPYITASIVIQLLTVAVPHLEKLMKEGGEEGRKKMSEYTRYSSIALSLIQSGGYLLGLGGYMTDRSWYAYLTVLIVQAAGAALAMWMGERITEKGVGNGISLLIFINIVSRLPVMINQTSMSSGTFSILGFFGFILLSIFLICAVTFIDLGQRRIPVQYAKRMVGRKVYGGQSTHIPLKLNNSGVLPLIFAMTLVSFPGMILANFVSGDSWFNHFALKYSTLMNSRSALYLGIQSVLILFFTYFYSQISFNPIDISKNIQQYGGFIPGIRPGKPTSDYLAKLSNRVNLFSSLFFMLLALIPAMFTYLYGNALTSAYGPTSILIMVGVALETSKQIEAQMLMRHYKGFLT